MSLLAREVSYGDNRRGNRHDDWWTPQALFESLCKGFGFEPLYDYAATRESSKCRDYMSDALHREWTHDGWLNPQNSKLKAFVEHGWRCHLKYGIALLMLIPLDALGRRYTKPIWEAHLRGEVEIQPIYERPSFLPHGRPAKHGGTGHNEYCAVYLKRREKSRETVPEGRFPPMFAKDDV